jgi:uncharacterized protein YegL
MPTYSQLTASERRVVLSNSPHHHPLSTKRESLIGFTLDRSGSMSSLAIVAVQSLNGLIEQQRAITAGDSCFTLALFNHDVRLIHDAVPLFDVPPLLPAQYEPSGGTALNDAIAHLIRSLSGHVHGRNTAVLAVILTDGEENQSRQHSKEDVRQMVTYRRLTHGWQFLFLGPESALSYALSVGIPKVNTAGFETTPEGLRLMLERVSRAISAYRLGDRKFMLALQGGRQNEQ